MATNEGVVGNTNGIATPQYQWNPPPTNPNGNAVAKAGITEYQTDISTAVPSNVFFTSNPVSDLDSGKWVIRNPGANQLVLAPVVYGGDNNTARLMGFGLRGVAGSEGSWIGTPLFDIKVTADTIAGAGQFNPFITNARFVNEITINADGTFEGNGVVAVASATAFGTPANRILCDTIGSPVILILGSRHDGSSVSASGVSFISTWL